MFRRAAVEAIGGIPDAIQIIPDYWLYVAVARRYPVRAVQEVVCRYRMHGANMSRLAAIRMNEEVLWLIDQWAINSIRRPSRSAGKRHFTAIALEEMRSLKTAPRGLARLLMQGSVASQLARPFMFVFHLIRRNVRLPYWRSLGDGGGGG